ncbi:hypothetical protein GCM10028801_38990 [Nocardioides maradonensis]
MPNLRRARTVVRRHPRVLMAAKTAFAAGAAWLVVQPIGGFVHHYPYYAPLGAAVAMSTTVAASMRFTLQSVAAILGGAVLALAVRALPIGEPAGIALVTGAGTLVAGWRFLGAMSGWVPIAGLFVLILGGDQPERYVVAYGGLTGVGALIGVGVNALLPQLPFAPASRAQADLRHRLARELDELTDGLDAEQRLDEGWEDVVRSLDPQMREVEDLLRVGEDARRANWRARRWTELADRRHRQGRSLRRLAGCVEEVVALTSAPDASVHDDGPAGTRLRTSLAAALRATADLVRAVDEDDPDAGSEEQERAADAVAELRRTVTRLLPESDQSRFDAAGIVASLERAVSVWR